MPSFKITEVCARRESPSASFVIISAPNELLCSSERRDKGRRRRKKKT
jgi:hypothetical protein